MPIHTGTLKAGLTKSMFRRMHVHLAMALQAQKLTNYTHVPIATGSSEATLWAALELCMHIHLTMTLQA